MFTVIVAVVDWWILWLCGGSGRLRRRRV